MSTSACKDLVPLADGVGIKVKAYPHPFKNNHVECNVPYTMTVKEIVEGLPLDKLEIWVNNEYLPREQWLMVPPVGAEVAIRAVPQRDVVRAALQIAIVVAAVYFAGPLGLKVGTALHAAFVGGVTLAGNLLLNALIPPAIPKAPTAGDPVTRLASLTGTQNRVARFDPIPRLFGHMRYYPPIPMTGLPFTELRGNDQYLRALFILGYGPLDINGVRVDSSTVKTLEDNPDLAAAIRIGETTVDNFEDVEIEIGNPKLLTLYSQTVVEETVDVAMNSASQASPGTVTDNIVNTRTTEEDVDEIAIDIEFPGGLFSVADDGTDRNSEVSFIVEYRPTGSQGAWTSVIFDETLYWYQQWVEIYGPTGDDSIVLNTTPTVWVIKAKSRRTVRRGLRWKVTPGQYDVRVTRYQTYNQGNNVGTTDCRWLSLKSIFKDRPFGVPNVVAMAMLIKATDELSGVLDNVSVEATSILPIWTGTHFIEEPTSSPAAAFIEALTGVGTRRPLDRTVDIDRDEMVLWHLAAEDLGLEFNYVSEGQTTLFELVRMIAAAGRATWAVKGNKISVIREESEQTPRQLFSPRNASNFRLVKSFPKTPHALRVQFVDPVTWQDTERTVYADGYDESNATLFELLPIPGVTSPDQAWKLGRFHLAQMQLRPEHYIFDAYIDSLIAQRGDAIGISNEAFLNGLAAGRIKGLTRSTEQEVLEIETDEEIFMEPDGTYYVTVRYIDDDGEVAQVTAEVETVSPSTHTLTLVDDTMPAEVQVGDLFVFGTIPVVPAKIIRIEPDDDLHATITAVPLAPEILTADSGEIPEYDPLLNNPIDLNALPPPVPEILRVRSDEKVLFRDADGSLRAQMVVDYYFPPGQPKVRVQMRFTEIDSPLQWRREEAPSDDGMIATLNVIQGATYDIQLRAINDRGLLSAWTPVTQHTVIGKSSPPSNVTGFTATVGISDILLQWNSVPDLDLEEYEIRRGSTWAGATFITRTKATRFRVQDPVFGNQQYLIKAIDTSGNESVTAASATATIAVPAASTLKVFPEIGGITVQVDSSALNAQANDLIRIVVSPTNNRNSSDAHHYVFPVQGNWTNTDIVDWFIPIAGPGRPLYVWGRFEDLFGNVGSYFPSSTTDGLPTRTRGQHVGVFSDYFDTYESLEDLQRHWDVIGTGSIEFITTGEAGGRALRITGDILMVSKQLFPYDPDGPIYQCTIKHRRISPPNSGTETLRAGFIGIGADGVTPLNNTGTITGISSARAYGVSMTGSNGPQAYYGLDEWNRSLGNVAGSRTTSQAVPAGRFGAAALHVPAEVHANVKYFRPVIQLASDGAVGDIDFLTITHPTTNIITATLVDPSFDIDPEWNWAITPANVSDHGWDFDGGEGGTVGYMVEIDATGESLVLSPNALLEDLGNTLTVRVRYKASGTLGGSSRIRVSANFGNFNGRRWITAGTADTVTTAFTADNTWRTAELTLDLTNLGDTSTGFVLLFGVEAGGAGSPNFTIHFTKVTLRWS